MVGGAVYGLLLRVLFGVMPPSLQGPMSVAFLIATPLTVGALTIYGARQQNLSVWSWMFVPWATIALMLAGCAATLLEGAICLALMAPLFLIAGSIGGVLMGVALRVVPSRQSSLKAVAVLPLLMILGDGLLPLPDRHLEIRRSIHIDAAPPTVWKQILTAREIRSEELPISITHLIGVPRPLEGVNRLTPDGEIRYSQWEKGVNFQAVVTNRRENESITWRYRFDAHSFPKGSMDEHVAIGGRYFDLDDTTFNLIRTPNGTTNLEIVAHFRVTSSVNFYAVPVAKFLGQDFVHTILSLYKNRSEGVESGFHAAKPSRPAGVYSVASRQRNGT